VSICVNLCQSKMKYYHPKTLTEFLNLKSKTSGKKVALLAGGTDLLPRYENGTPLPDHLIDLKNIPDLDSISFDKDELIFGSLVTIQELHDYPVVQAEFTALYKAAHEFAGPQIRHRGTLGGNICNASPAGDLLPVLYAFDAQLTIQGPDKKRELPIAEFILGPGKTDLQDNEILVSITLQRKQQRSKFQKVGLRQSMAIAVVNLAYVWEENTEGMSSLRIAAGSVAPTVVTLDLFTSAYLKTPHDLSTHLSLIDDAIAPIDDIRATARYRRTVLKNLIKDFLER